VIFVTVGEQLPFDRLVHVVDAWAAVSGKEVFAQIGNSDFKPNHIHYKKFLSPEAFKANLLEAEIIISHAGMGTIISALEIGKQIIVMPRKRSLGEVRNDHQDATARRFFALNYVEVAFDEIDLLEKLDDLNKFLINEKKVIRGPAPSLIKAIKDLIDRG
jgi:UDP-N-acetylglucosamine transferase subunit ALG13